MNTKPIERQFDRLGVRIKITRPRPTRRAWGWGSRGARESEDYSLDVQRDRKGEYFMLTVPEALENGLCLQVLQARPHDRHLLLMVRKDPAAEIDRFLCGHDEREWFVAAVPDRVSTVDGAKESLKPQAVRWAQAQEALDRDERNRRKNRAFRRQGEWFFLPVPWRLRIVDSLVLRHEPISRSGGKPHIVEQLYRSGGQAIYTCPEHPDGVSEERYRRLIQNKPKARGYRWTMQRINPSVYAKGKIRHPDHKTIVLPDWHHVLMNTENQSRTMQHVAFID